MSSDSLRLLEIVDKIQAGSPCRMIDFDAKVLPKRLDQLVKEYEIRYDPENPLPADDSLADDVFKAGLRLFLDVGIFCIDNGRILKFEENEVTTCLRNLTPEVVVGAGRDTRKLYRRNVEDPRPPVISGGSLGGPLSPGRPFVDAMTSIALEPMVSMMIGGSLQEVEGRRLTIGTPVEVHAARCEAMWMREAAVRAGRPGLHLVGSSTATSAAAEIACSDPLMGYRPTDGRNACVLTSLKIDYNMLNKVKHFLDYSTFISTYMDEMIGGYTQGPEGTAICAVASELTNMLVNQATYQAICIVHLHHVNTTDRMCLWAQNLVGQALARNTKIIDFQTCMTSAGPCTEMILYETAAVALGVPSGVNLTGIMSAGSKLKDRYTGLEQRFFGEVGYAAARLKRKTANELITRILPKYEGRFENPPHEKTFQDCYDTEKLKPREEWLKIYEKVKLDLLDLGLDLRYDQETP